MTGGTGTSSGQFQNVTLFDFADGGDDGDVPSLSLIRQSVQVIKQDAVAASNRANTSQRVLRPPARIFCSQAS